MGASLCCMRPSQQATIDIIKSPDSTSKKRVSEAQEEARMDSGSTTLKDCLVNSPNNNLVHRTTNPTKQQNINARSPPSQVMSSPEVRSAEFYTPRISFSSDNRYGKLLKVDERYEDEDDDESSSTPILKRIGSQKSKKKVSFRFPQEADIFIFYSPKQNFEDN